MSHTHSLKGVHYIFMFDGQIKSYTDYRLQVHLPGFQTKAFLEGEEREALQREAEKDTTLTAWFKLNLEHERLQDEGVDH
ncbi:hypothetical protein Y032_0345g3101 [Ancylostoma ceylanicum]|uniref:Uncharacterized protein n=1 Tax=Ancylostoma ceylanicum TaxID=53326 RepID=A0A016RY33_9BILA|nr:hypothetical protein Y032_0345g3101 [Ancylostoma ceylanicum]